MAGDEWNLGKLAGLSKGYFWAWAKTDTMGYDGHVYLAMDERVNFERGLWFKLGGIHVDKAPELLTGPHEVHL